MPDSNGTCTQTGSPRPWRPGRWREARNSGDAETPWHLHVVVSPDDRRCTVKAYPDSVDWTPQGSPNHVADKWAESQKLGASDAGEDGRPRLLSGRSFRAAWRLIKKADLLLTEVSFKGLYEGEWLFDDLYRVVRDLGFSCIGTGHPTADKTTGRSLQNDILFARGSCQRKLMKTEVELLLLDRHPFPDTANR